VIFWLFLPVLSVLLHELLIGGLSNGGACPLFRRPLDNYVPSVRWNTGALLWSTSLDSFVYHFHSRAAKSRDRRPSCDGLVSALALGTSDGRSRWSFQDLQR